MVLLLLHVLYMYTAKIMNHFSNVFEMNFAYHHLMTLFSVKIWWSKFETYENFSEHCVINIMWSFLFFSVSIPSKVIGRFIEILSAFINCEFHPNVWETLPLVYSCLICVVRSLAQNEGKYNVCVCVCVSERLFQLNLKYVSLMVWFLLWYTLSLTILNTCHWVLRY